MVPSKISQFPHVCCQAVNWHGDDWHRIARMRIGRVVTQIMPADPAGLLARLIVSVSQRMLGKGDTRAPYPAGRNSKNPRSTPPQ